MLALTLLGCGNGDSASSGERLSPEQTVRSYVAALNSRDGSRFCELVAPHISGRFDLAGRDPEGPFRGRSGCAKLISAFIGYIEDCCPPKFLRASIREFSVGAERHDLLPVELKLDVLQEDTATHRKRTEPLDDTVWLARFRGEWRIAKLSAVAQAASLVGDTEGEDVLAPPDLAAEARRFAAERKQYREHRRAQRASYGSTGELADCSAGLVVEDGADDPRAGHLDLRSLTIRSSNGQVCLDYETAAAVEGPADLVFNLRDSPAGTRFIQVFHIELRRDGSTRVTSGEDDAGHPIPVPARIGREGNRLTVVLDRESFDTGEPTPMSTGDRPLGRFVFMAGVTGDAGGGRVLRDDLGPSRPQLPYRYPDGKACELAASDC